MGRMEKAAQFLAAEREGLASGQRPTPRFQNKVQHRAYQALGVFFALVLVFTILSRAAVGITVARVGVAQPMSGILTQRTTINGSIAAQGDWELTLPGGLRVEKIAVAVGERVAAGDVLLELDEVGLRASIEKIRGELALLDLKIEGAAKGNASGSTASILNAQAALRTAQEDYARLIESRSAAEGRSTEDVTTAQSDYDKAVAALEKAKSKAKSDLIKTAEDSFDAAKEALATTQESAKEALDAATASIQSAEDQQTSADSSHYAALNTYHRAVEAAKRAQAEYDAAVGTEGESAALAALNQALSARDQAGASADSLGESSNNAYRALKRAKENQKMLQEKWAAKEKKAEESRKESEDKLAEAQSRSDLSEEAGVVSAQASLDSAQRALKSAQRSMDDGVSATADQLLTAQRAIDNAQRTLAQAEDAAAEERRTDQNARKQAEVERLGYVNDRREAQKKLDHLLSAAANGGTLTAPAAGTVLTILSETGLTTEGSKVASLSRNDQGFAFTGKIEQKEAEQLSLGDEGMLTFTIDGRTHETKATLTSVGLADDQGMVVVTVQLPDGNYPTGASAKWELSKRSETHSTVLPLGALRSEGSESYVLIVQEKQTVLGLEQTVKKVPITVEEKDSEQMAVTAPALTGSDSVIISTNKPLAEGDRVRVNADE